MCNLFNIKEAGAVLISILEHFLPVQDCLTQLFPA
jgi:hypothetical protein